MLLTLATEIITFTIVFVVLVFVEGDRHAHGDTTISVVRVGQYAARGAKVSRGAVRRSLRIRGRMKTVLLIEQLFFQNSLLNLILFMSFVKSLHGHKRVIRIGIITLFIIKRNSSGENLVYL